MGSTYSQGGGGSTSSWRDGGGGGTTDVDVGRAVRDHVPEGLRVVEAAGHRGHPARGMAHQQAVGRVPAAAAPY